MRVLRMICSSLAAILMLGAGGLQITESNPGHFYLTGNWEKLLAAPGPIRSTAMAYSPHDDMIVLYGGRATNGQIKGDLWTFDIDTKVWTMIQNPHCNPSCPAPRSVHSMVYDESSRKFIVFGGYLVSGHSNETNETWTYDLATNTWQRLDFGTKPVPAPRHWGSLEYNTDEGATYLFGGHFNNGACPGDKMYNDVWKLNLAGALPTWTNLNPNADPNYGKPAPRQSDWVYNTNDNKFYVFGGKQELGPPPGTQCGPDVENQATFYNDIWKYDPATNAWSRVQAGNTDYTHYPKERRTDIVFDDVNNRIVFFGGLPVPSSYYIKDTWSYDFDVGKWTTLQDSDGRVPEVRVAFAGAWDRSRSQFYIYGVDEATKNVSFWRLTIHAQNVSVNCSGLQPVIFGTDGKDELAGSKAQDVMVGIGGDDSIRGGNGFDFICGDSGNDLIFGEDGADKLFGLDGNDEIHGGTGNDRLIGGSGDDKLFGDLGADFFDCGAGTDAIMDFSQVNGDTKSASCEIF